jgi:hypothetical protein
MNRLLLITAAGLIASQAAAQQLPPCKFQKGMNYCSRDGVHWRQSVYRDCTDNGPNTCETSPNPSCPANTELVTRSSGAPGCARDVTDPQ